MLHPTTHRSSDSFQLHDGTAPKPHHTWQATNSVLWPSKPAFLEPDDSGICSPPMWTTSPPRQKSHYRSLSPTSRTQAIVRGQRELMEMVRNMPESNYELSLKDLVEHHRVDATQDNTVVEEEEERNFSMYRRERGGVGGGGSRKIDKMPQVKVKRNGNIDRGGFYLKMVFPFSLGSKDKKKKKKNMNMNMNMNKKKNESSANSSSKVSPKPDGSAKGVDKEWWKKSPSACRDSDSGSSSISSRSVKSSRSSSSSSTSSRRSNSRRETRGNRRCWPFISRPKSLTEKK